MSLHLPSRRLAATASTAPCPSSLLPALQSLRLVPSVPAVRLHPAQRRHAWFSRAKPSVDQPEEGTTRFAQNIRNRLMKRLTGGTLEGDSIFGDDLAAVDPSQPKRAPRAAAGEPKTPAGASLLREHLARAVDPDPRSRARWERKMVIRHVATATDPFSRESRAARIARTERALLSKSPFLPTSVKKLVKLARQIRGKTLDDALAQMRYSKKKMAAEVRVQLELARDRAVVERGMGLGRVRGEVADGAAPVQVQDKDGRWVAVDDPTRMYVAESWVGRGPWRGKRLNYRARGRADVIQRPSTSITVVLKEEKTRIREHQEREAKKYRQGPWVHLPDRPVTAQRQYYSW